MKIENNKGKKTLSTYMYFMANEMAINPLCNKRDQLQVSPNNINT